MRAGNAQGRAGISISVHSQVPSTGWGRTPGRDWRRQTEPQQKSGKHFLPDPTEHSTHHTQASEKQTHFNQSSSSFSVGAGCGEGKNAAHYWNKFQSSKKFFFKQQGDRYRCFKWPKIRRISNEFPQGIVSDFWFQKSVSFIVMITRPVNYKQAGGESGLGRKKKHLGIGETRRETNLPLFSPQGNSGMEQRKLEF